MTEQPLVVMCVLMCDRKKHFMLTPLESMLAQDYPVFLYFNIETTDPESWKPLIDCLKSHGREEGVHYHVDYWNFQSTWFKKPAFDQDQQRLVPICMGRNMCIDVAMAIGAEYLQFVDSDMTFPSYTVSKLLSRGKKLIGGLVPGRNTHNEIHYVFGPVGGITDHGELYECDFGNIGFVLIHKDIFQRIRFRKGPQAHKADKHLDWASDDPNFCYDAVHLWGFDRFFVDKTVKVDHKDDEVLNFENGAQY